MKFKETNPPVSKYDYKTVTNFRQGVLESYITLNDFNTYDADDTHNGYFELDYDIERMYYVSDSSHYINIPEEVLTAEELEDVEYEIIRVLRDHLQALGED